MATSFSDYSNPYITEIYNQKKQAAADALTSAYQQNMANYDAQEQQTAQNYDNQRNHTQAQYEQALRNFDEYSGANGLNSGAKAQARLAYGNQNQAGLSNLSAAESAALQQIARDRAGAQSQYQADLAANESAYDTDLYNALYGAWQDQVAQDNADRSYYNTLAMDMIQTGSVPDANTLARAGIDSATATTMAAYYANLRAQEQAESDRNYYYNLAMDMIQTGNTPDANTLTKAGIDSASASTMASYYRALLNPSTSGGSSGGGSSRRSSGGSGGSSGSGSSGSDIDLSALSALSDSGSGGSSSGSSKKTTSKTPTASDYAAHLVGPSSVLSGGSKKTTTTKKTTNTGGGGKMLATYR